ncbi:MAG: hypothetical protein N2445_01850, partial [Acidobacteria bacterium]|nr:hypothetical protein [Acidobacteriota bacterium]
MAEKICKEFLKWVLLASVLIFCQSALIGSQPNGATANNPVCDENKTTFTETELEKKTEDLRIASSKPENILIRTAIFDPLAQGEPTFSDFSFPEETPEEWDYFLLQFFKQPSDNLIQELNKEGVFFFKYIPNNTYIVSAETKMVEEILKNHSEIRWIGLFKGGYKVEPKLLTRSFSGNVQLDFTLFYGEDPFAILAQLQEIDNSVKYSNLFHRDTESILRVLVNGESLRKFVQKASAIRGIEAIDYWILPHLMNNDSIWVVQSYDTVNKQNYSLSAT